MMNLLSQNRVLEETANNSVPEDASSWPSSSADNSYLSPSSTWVRLYPRRGYGKGGIPPATVYWSAVARSFNPIRVCKTSFHLWRPTQVSEQGENVWHHPCLHLCWVANEITWWVWRLLKSMLILLIIKSTFKFTTPWGSFESLIFHRCVRCSGF